MSACGKIRPPSSPVSDLLSIFSGIVQACNNFKGSGTPIPLWGHEPCYRWQRQLRRAIRKSEQWAIKTPLNCARLVARQRRQFYDVPSRPFPCGTLCRLLRAMSCREADRCQSLLLDGVCIVHSAFEPTAIADEAVFHKST